MASNFCKERSFGVVSSWLDDARKGDARAAQRLDDLKAKIVVALIGREKTA